MKHIIKAAFITLGIGLLMTIAYDLARPDLFFTNNARTIYFVAFMLLVFAALSMKNILAYKTKSKIDFIPRYNEAKTSGLTITIILLFILGPMFDQPEKFGICECQWIRWVGCLFMIDAIFFFSWSAWILGKTFFRNDGKSAELKIVKTGPYAVIRHPRYLAVIAWSLSTALVFNNIAALLLAVIVTWIVGMKAHDEETFMELEFGEDWIAYKRDTYRFLPLIY